MYFFSRIHSIDYKINPDFTTAVLITMGCRVTFLYNSTYLSDTDKQKHTVLGRLYFLHCMKGTKIQSIQRTKRRISIENNKNTSTSLDYSKNMHEVRDKESERVIKEELQCS